ncbi:MAG TPA: hypothetical protein VIL17_04685, partial [Coriobacteriia bacterium]
GLRVAAFRRFREIVDAYYTERIESALPVGDRVLMRLISEGRADEFAEYLAVLAQAGSPRVLVEGEHLFVELPWFRDTDRGIPDRLFDIGGQMKAECRMEPFVVDPQGVHLSAECRLGVLTDRIDSVDLVIRSRADKSETIVPLAHKVVFEEVRPFVLIEDVLPPDRLFAGLPEGMYDLYVRVSAGETWRERRVSECTPPSSGSRIVHCFGEDGSATSAVLDTTPKGALSLRVLDGVGADVRLLDGPQGPLFAVSQLPAGVAGGPAPIVRFAGRRRTVELPPLEDSFDGPTRILSLDARGLDRGRYAMRVKPGSAGDLPLVAVNAPQRLELTADRGGWIWIDGSSVAVVSQWRHVVGRTRGRLLQALRRVAKRLLRR